MATMTFEELVRQLASLYGSDLQSVVLYGSTVAGEYVPGLSDRNVLVLLERLDLERMRGEAAIARGWREAGNPPPLTLTLREWRGCADVFPMEVADILELHRVLHGTPPFDGMAVDREHLRLQLEQQSLGKLIQLRQGVLASGGDDAKLLELLAASLSTFMVIFRAASRLHGEKPPTDYDALTQHVGERVGFDAAPFRRVIAHVRGGEKLAPKDSPPILTGWLDGLERLVAHVDALGRPAPRGTPP